MFLKWTHKIFKFFNWNGCIPQKVLKSVIYVGCWRIVFFNSETIVYTAMKFEKKEIPNKWISLQMLTPFLSLPLPKIGLSDLTMDFNKLSKT